MQSEVFRPSTGTLQVRGPVSEGMPVSMDWYRKRDVGARPVTQGGYRFGQLSRNSFFARHNPHPGRVRHIKGLLDVPICSVNDDGYFANARYSLKFPPNTFEQNKLASHGLASSGAGSTSGAVKVMSMPVGTINVNSKTHPVNSITGLQNFLGKPMNFRVFREKAVPRIGMVPVTDAWRDELKALTEAAGLAAGNQLPRQPFRPPTDQGRPRTTRYSSETGRLIPPPSRAMSRAQSRAASRAGFGTNFQHIAEDPDQENMILQMLCQILQTDDVNAVQSWLVSAGDREKAMVLDMIKSALNNTNEYYKQDATERIPEEVNDITNDVLGGCEQVDRLTLDGGSPAPRPPTMELDYFQDPIMEEEILKPLLPDVFRRPGTVDLSAGCPPPARTPGKAASPGFGNANVRLRFTTTSSGDRGLPAPAPLSFLNEDKVWQTGISV